MLDSDRKKFMALMTAVSDYYEKPLATGPLALYWEGLKHFDYPSVERALWAHTQNPDTGQFMPKIADVTKMLQGKTTDRAAVAWSKVDAAVRRVGTYRDVAFDDAIIHRVLADMGGWIPLGTKNEDEWPFVAREFENRYRGYCSRGESPEYPPVLIGIANAQNAEREIPGQPPVLIGVEAAAQRVIFGGTNAPLIAMRAAGELMAPGAAGQKMLGRAA